MPPIGKWTGLQKTPGDSKARGDDQGVFVIHSTLLHTGNILMWSGHVEGMQYLPEAWIWNPNTDISKAVRVPFPAGIDIFCCYHVQLPDGRILIAGGSMPHKLSGGRSGDAHGIKDICIFDPTTNRIQKIGKMFEGRWYPTIVQLADDSYVAISGYTDNLTIGRELAISAEIFHAPFEVPLRATYRTIQLNGGTKAFPTYPGMLLSPDGKIFHLGTNWQYSGFDTSGNPIYTVVQTSSITINTQTNTAIWDDSHPDRRQKHREEGTFVLLPPAQDGKMLVVGGGHITNYSSELFNSYSHEAGVDRKDAEYLDTRNPAAGWQPAGTSGKMNLPRVNCSAVILPNGKVLIIGGTSNFKWQSRDAGGINNGSIPSNECELYDPVTNSFTLVASLNESRTYHSSAMLLPDGRIWVAGGVDPEKPYFADNGGVIASNRKTMEFYEPSYLDMPRPTIRNIVNLAQDQSLGAVYRGQEFIIQTPNAATIDKAAMLRPCAMTHHTDTQQRYVNLPITNRGADWIQVQTPLEGAVAPSGYYMIWIIDNQEAPCEHAFFLQIRPAITNYTAGTFNYGGVNFNVHIHNAVPALEFEGEHFHGFTYLEDKQQWLAPHVTFAAFDTLNKLAEFLIDADAYHDHA